MVKLSPKEKEEILASLKAMRSEEVQMAVALEVRRQSNERCTLPVVDNFQCQGCVSREEQSVLKLRMPQDSKDDV